MKDYIIGRLPQIMRLDGEDISRSQRIQAKAKLPQLEKSLQSSPKKLSRRKSTTLRRELWRKATREKTDGTCMWKTNSARKRRKRKTRRTVCSKTTTI